MKKYIQEKHCHSTFSDYQDWCEANTAPFDQTLWAKVELNISDSLNDEEYKLYINGNIEVYGNLKEKIKSPLYLSPGSQKIIFKDYEAQKENRKESNIILLNLEASTETKIRLSRKENKLELKVEQED